MVNSSNRKVDGQIAHIFAVLSVLCAFGRWYLLGQAINSVPEKIVVPTSIFDQLPYRLLVALSDPNFQVFCYSMIIANLVTSVILLIGLYTEKSWLCVPAIVYSWVEFVISAIGFCFFTEFGYFIALKLFPDTFFASKTFGKVTLVSIVGFLITVAAIFAINAWSNVPGGDAKEMKMHFEEDEKRRAELTKYKQPAKNPSYESV